MDFLSKGLKTLIDLKRCLLPHRLTHSHQQRVRQLLPARDHAEAAPALHRVERRFSVDWVPPDRPAAPVAAHHREYIPSGLWCAPSRQVLIHVNTGNQVEISINDVLDALYDYAWIHFTEEEELFMNNEYPFLLPVVSFTARSIPSLPSTRSSTLFVLLRSMRTRTFWPSLTNCDRN